LLVLRSAVERVLGRPVGVAFVVLTSTQFHLPFYASRPLANTIALVPTAVALAAMFARSRPRVATALLTFTTVRSHRVRSRNWYSNLTWCSVRAN
jgi:alpha-1,6-mannosyltransferase